MYVIYDILKTSTQNGKEYYAYIMYNVWKAGGYIYSFTYLVGAKNRSTEGCSKLRSPETRQVQEILVSTLEHLQVPKWDRTRCPEE